MMSLVLAFLAGLVVGVLLTTWGPRRDRSRPPRSPG